VLNLGRISQSCQNDLLFEVPYWVILGGALLFGVVLSLTLGYAYYKAIERPALRFFKKYLEKK